MSIPSIRTPEAIYSPALIVCRDRVRKNILTMLHVAGHADRLRPHCKTHKMASVIKLQLASGIHKHKAATIAEAEMLAYCGVRDIAIGYPMVGPNLQRIVQFRQQYPEVTLSVTADDPVCIDQLGAAVSAAGTSVRVLLDINPGRDRTGVAPGDVAGSLYRRISETPGLIVDGFHFYDGHLTASSPLERATAVNVGWQKLSEFRNSVIRAGLSVPRVLCGGTPTFTAYAAIREPHVELCPGTCLFHDVGYGERYEDLQQFAQAAYVLTRVVSRPTESRVTFDVGTKAVASDPAQGQRVVFPEIPDAIQVLHNEEHLVIETSQASKFRPGDWTLVIPRHICPTSALYSSATVIENGEIVDEWKVTARDRCLRV
ncbi:D-TA family PLP-dependent enzyme [Planctomicrobium sp. SH668]|uniref:D-TA family PLP-dependent enzyme n=1 Tax=Planctomicrobium sp. SH668 TaxID=3448126 RepID=UPI003F5C9596